MKRIVVGTVVTCLAAGGLGVANADGARRPACTKAVGRTLARSPGLRIFFKTRRVDVGYRHTLYGCRPGTRSLHRLDQVEESGDNPQGYSSAQVAGTRYAAVDEFNEYEAGYIDDVVVFDVLAGRRLARIRVTDESGARYRESLSGFGLTPEGAIAVLTESAEDVTGPHRIVVDDAAGRRTLANAVDITGFGVSGSTVSWEEGGVEKSATLSGPAGR